MKNVRRSLNGRGQQGFTLFELLVVLCIVMCLFALLAPNVGLVLGKKKVTKAMNDCRRVGDAMASWIVLHGGAPQSTVTGLPATPTIDTVNFTPITHADLQALLVPAYLPYVPQFDGWGHPYDYFLDQANPSSPDAVLCRSSGRDGISSASSYLIGTFDVTLFNEDIVWADGNFVRWPG